MFLALKIFMTVVNAILFIVFTGSIPYFVKRKESLSVAFSNLMMFVTLINIFLIWN